MFPAVKLRDVVDLEVQLSLDEGQDEATLRARDRELYLEMSEPPAPGAAAQAPRPPSPTSTDSLLVAWLSALRARFGEPRVGERVAAGQRLLAYALALTGLASGWGTAELLLHFEQGAAPINVGYYLLVMVLGQLAMLALLALGLLVRRVFPQLPVLGDVARLLRFLAARLQRVLQDHDREAAERLEERQAALQRVRTRLGLYARLERNLLLSQSQLFAVAFNIGALASCLRLILFSDLAFAWSTSMTSLDASQVHRFCTVLSWPFAWLVPDAVPTRTLIEHTQYFRLEGRYAGAALGSRGSAALAGQWWQFLVACTLTYGLLPRLCAYGVFALRYWRAAQSLPLDTPSIQRVLTRMVTPAVSTRAHDLVAQSAEPALPAQTAALGFDVSAALVLYRDIPTDSALLAEAISRHLGLSVTSVHRAGGLDVHAEKTLLETLSEDSASVVLVAEAWEAPDKSLRHLLSALRGVLGARRALRVVLIGQANQNGFAAPEDDDVRVYRDRLTLLADPYLSVDTLPASAPQPALGEEVST